MLKNYVGACRLFCGVAAALLLNAQQGNAHLSRDECVQGSGCVAGQQGGQATFEFTANTTANPPLHSGSFSFTDVTAGISVSSDELTDYADAGNESERLLNYRLEGNVYSEARLFVTDSGPSASDSFRIQLLDLSGVPIVEIGGPLLTACAGGITTAPACIPPVPCELQLTVACSVVSTTPGSTNNNECSINGASGEIDFFYTIRNTGTAALPLSALTGTDSFGPLDLSSLGTGLLQPGEEITLMIRELVSGPFPFVNTVTLNATQNTSVCSDMATIMIKREANPPGGEPGAECDDFVTGGGWIVGTPSGKKANFGIHAGIRKNGLWGGLNYIDHKTRMHVKSTAITEYTHVSEVGRQIKFNVRINGEEGTAIVIVHDNGEPGRNDRFEIQLSNSYSAGADLGGDRPGGGNIQLHKKDCDGQGGGSTGGATGGSTGGATGGSTGGEPGGSTGGNPGGGSSTDACPFTIGYWKNHDSHLAQVLGKGSIALGDGTVATVAEVLAVLNAANATDARVMLRAQLLATLLNLQNGSDAMNTGADIRLVTQQAVEFVATHSSEVDGQHPDRALALSLKDRLDAYNNTKTNCEAADEGSGSGSGESDGGISREETSRADSANCSHSQQCKSQADCERRTKAEAFLKKKQTTRK